MSLSPSKRILLAESIVVFILMPLAIAWFRPMNWMYIMLWLGLLLALRVLVKHHAYDFRTDWNFAALNTANLRYMFLRFIPFALVLTGFTLYAVPERFLMLPSEKPQLWIMIMLLYPIISVMPQELIFRSFFIRRYATLMVSHRTMIVANALAFGWVHIVLLNWVAVVFSAVGGLLFAHTYYKTRSLAAVFVEHALYGCFIFTIGLGWFFYRGAVTS
jgi:membrane protease YdiL (CAAX protease family)